MKSGDFTQFFIYKWRYVIGYVSIGLLLAGLMVFAAMYVPGGLSSAEIISVVESNRVDYSNLSTLAILNLPYHALQDVLLTVFGPSIFIIKLPSLIFSLLTIAGLIFLLRKWFKPNISVLASIIAVTGSQFIFIAQQGSQDILYIFWPTAILLLGTLISRAKTHRVLWKVLFGATASLSLYTPLSIYMILAVAITIAAHPHLRAIIRRLSPKRIAISIGTSLVILLPLIISIFHEPKVVSQLLGIPEQWPNLATNIETVLKQYFLFWQPGTATLITPVFGLGSFIIIGCGIWQLIRTRETSRSYMIMIWFLCLSPIIVLNPDIVNATFTITALLIASGLTAIIEYWYRLFPKNPYARVAGLVPIIILVATLIGSGAVRYAYAYHYSPSAANIFSNDLKLLPEDTKELVVSEDEKDFYEAISNYSKKTFEVTQEATGETVTITRQGQKPEKGYRIDKIITNKRAEDADRFYIYTKI